MEGRLRHIQGCSASSRSCNEAIYPILALSWHSSGRTEENDENLWRDKREPGQDSNLAPPDCESRAVQLHQSLRFVFLDLFNDDFTTAYVK
jgi:hypothetical protein